jgi:histidinol-phosphate aminotransferase
LTQIVIADDLVAISFALGSNQRYSDLPLENQTVRLIQPSRRIFAMPVSRRDFAIGVSASTAWLCSGFAGELLGAHPEAAKLSGSKKARILFNENPLGPSPLSLSAIESSASMLGRYPLSEGPRLEMKLRKMHGLSYHEASGELSLGPPPPLEGTTDLLLGIGSSEILKSIAWAYSSQAGNIVEAHPSYSAVGDSAAAIPGNKIERRIIPLNAQNRVDITSMIQAISADTKVVVICNPNNPTGTTIPLSQIEAIADATPKTALLLVDEAYIEFLPHAEKISAMELAKTRENVLVARTFSKIYGLAGLRVGYAVASTEVISRIKPFMLGRLSMGMAGVLAAEAALDDKQHIAKTRALHQKTQEQWERGFRAAGWKMTASDVGFCWVDLEQDSTPLISFLAERNVLISGGKRWNLPNCVRISMGTELENDQLMAGVRDFKRG